jgi:rfaE bifunctional protein kinase chain/domain
MKKILFVGDVMLDEWIYTVNERQSPETGVPIFKRRESFAEVGGVGNACRHALNLGLENELHLISMIGDDVAGKLVCSLFDLKNLSLHLVKDDSRRTTIKSRYFQEMKPLFRIDTEDNFEMNEEVEKEFLKLINLILPLCDRVLISDYGKSVVSKKILSAITGIARKQNILTVIDAYPSTLFWVEDVDIVKPNQIAWTQYCNSFMSEMQAIEDLLVRRRVRSLLITRGAKGMTYLSQNFRQDFEAEKVNVIDVTGAGDSIAAGIVSLADGLTDIPAIVPKLLEIGSKAVAMNRTILPRIIT